MTLMEVYIYILNVYKLEFLQRLKECVSLCSKNGGGYIEEMECV